MVATSTTNGKVDQVISPKLKLYYLQELKAKNKAVADIYGLCKVDGHIQKVGNFRLEPPGLFRGRGDHPKQGKVRAN